MHLALSEQVAGCACRRRSIGGCGRFEVQMLQPYSGEEHASILHTIADGMASGAPTMDFAPHQPNLGSEGNLQRHKMITLWHSMQYAAAPPSVFSLHQVTKSIIKDALSKSKSFINHKSYCQQFCQHYFLSLQSPAGS